MVQRSKERVRRPDCLPLLVDLVVDLGSKGRVDPLMALATADIAPGKLWHLQRLCIFLPYGRLPS